MEFSVDRMMDNSFVLVKDDNEYGVFCERMRHAGFLDIPLPYRGIWPKTLVHGDVQLKCAVTHFSIVNMAMTLGLDHVTIFESDAYPMTNGRSRLDDFLKGGVPDDAREITFGNLHFIRDWENRAGHDKRLIDVDASGRFGRIKDVLWGSHAVVILKDGYREWLDRYIASGKRINSDWFNDLTTKCYATTRSFFIQVKDRLCYPEMLRDKQWLTDFPPIR